MFQSRLLIGPVCFFAGAMLMTGLGCSGGASNIEVEKLPTHPVSGTVMISGKPLPDADVRFVAVSDGKVAPRGKTDSNGKYTLSSFAVDDGAPVGKYKVLVTISVVKEGDEYEAEPDFSKSPVNMKFGSPKTTPLEAEVKDGENKFDFEVTK